MLHAVLIVLAVICLTPFLSMVSSSFMDIRGVLPDVPVIFPETPLYTENYVKVWTANNFSRYFVNTLLLSRRRPRRQRGDLHLDGVQLLAV